MMTGGMDSQEVMIEIISVRNYSSEADPILTKINRHESNFCSCFCTRQFTGFCAR